MGSGMSSMIKSGVSEVNQANIVLNKDKPLQIFKVSSLVAFFVSIILILIGALTGKKQKPVDGAVPPVEEETKKPSSSAIILFVGLGLLFLSIILLLLYRYIAAINHTKDFAVKETARMIING